MYIPIYSEIKDGFTGGGTDGKGNWGVMGDIFSADWNSAFTGPGDDGQGNFGMLGDKLGDAAEAGGEAVMDGVDWLIAQLEAMGLIPEIDRSVLDNAQDGMDRWGGTTQFEGRNLLPEDLMAYLQAVGAGTTAGAGQLGAQNAVDRSSAQARSLGVSAQGAPAGATARYGQQMGEQIGLEGINMVNAARDTDMQNANALLLAGTQQQQAMNDQMQLGQEQLYNEMLGGYESAGMQLDNMEMQRRMQILQAAMSGAGAFFGGII